MNHTSQLLSTILLLLLVGCQAGPSAGARGGTASSPTAARPQTVAPAASAQLPVAPVPPLSEVRVGILNSGADIPFRLAQERGYLREQGIEMTTQVFNGAQQMIAPLGADQLDIGGGAPGPGLFNAIQRGVNLRIVADRVRMVPGSRFNCLMIRKALLDSGEVQAFTDLRGRVFAENVPAVATTYAFERELRRWGLGLQDVTVTVLAFPDMLAAYANGAIDAAFVVEPFVTLAEERGVAQCWRPTGDLVPDFQLAVVLYGPTFAEQRADLARRFMVAYLRAARDYVRAFFGDGEGRDQLLQLLAELTGSRDMALLARQAALWLDPNGTVNKASLVDVQRWYRERGDLAAEVDLDRAVDPSFVDYALGQLGPYRQP
ncbi:MAG TPA: ABC transporter substrate-binding protein [Chloroflexota bacterium]|nr:ABC transporter substrate-binding protein [Chloroflexota bacterium]